MVLDDRKLLVHGVKSIPPDWKTVHLKDVVDAERPITYGVVVPGEFCENGTLLIRAKDYSNGWAEPGDMYRVGPDIDRAYRRSVVQPRDILLTIVGSVGNVARVPSWLSSANITQQTARVAPDTSLACGDFIFNYLQSHLAKREVYQFLKVGAQPALNLADVAKFKLLYPPLPEQQKIAAILSTWDRAIELTEKLIAAKQRRKQALMQQLLTGKVRLPGFGRTVWKKCHLGDVAKNSSRRNGNSTDQPTVYSVTNSVGMIPMEEGVIGESIDRYKTVSRFDFAYNPMRINVGSIFMWEGDEDVLVSPDYVVFRCGSKLDAEFLNHFRKTHYWRHFVTRAGGGSVRVRIYFSDLASMKLKLPSVEEQRSIAKVLNAQDEELRLLDRRRDALKRQKKGLMQQLLTGKVRVRT